MLIEEISDGGVWNQCTHANLLERNETKLPVPGKPVNSSEELPFVFVTDDAFSLKPYLMKPFPFRNQTPHQRIFSYRLSRARRVVENAFGIMAKRFRILQTPILLSPDKAVKVVLTFVVLHNYLRRENAMEYVGNVYLDREQEEYGTIIPGSWRGEGNMTPLERTRECHYSARKFGMPFPTISPMKARLLGKIECVK